jgi:hypothetical protein
MLRVKDVELLEGFHVRLMLTDGTVVVRDIEELLEGPAFAVLKADPRAFRDVRVVGGTLVWGSGADLCPDTLIWGGSPPVTSREPQAFLRISRLGLDGSPATGGHEPHVVGGEAPRR